MSVKDLCTKGRVSAAFLACALAVASPLAAQDTTAPAAPSFEAPAAPQAPEAPATEAPAPAASGTPEGAAPEAVAPAPVDAAEETSGATAPEAVSAPDTGAATEAPATTPSPAPAAPQSAFDRAIAFLENGGPAIWAITALSVVTLALILWKTWSLLMAGAWSRRPSAEAVALWEQGRPDAALKRLEKRHGLRSRMARTALTARLRLGDDQAREETTRVAKRMLADQSGGLRALELIATIAPLLGLLGTVMGMIAAFQALQEAGNRADPALLAGGIWEALLTTAAGMAVAIPASAALTWFESVIDNVRADMEDLAARIFVADRPHTAKSLHEIDLAAE